MFNLFPQNKQWNKNYNQLAIVFPNRYSGGFYSLAIHILYNIAKNNPSWYPSLNFLDNNDLKNKDLIAFTFQYELDYLNFKKILQKNNIPLEKNKRKEIIFAGGPCINSNPLTLSNYIDFFVLSPIETTLPKILDIYEDCKEKSVFLEKIKNIPGVFIPNINTPNFIAPESLDNLPYPIEQPLPIRDPSMIFKDVFMLEIERGCPFSCNFCSLSALYKKTLYRSLNNLKEIIDKGIEINKRDKVIIYSASFTHNKRKDLLQYLLEKNLEFSVPSIKTEIMDFETLKLIKQGNQNTLTIAPECNESLRKELNKHLTDNQIFNFIEDANKLKFKTLKMYFMLGLPNQTKEDLNEMMQLIKKVKQDFKGSTYISINPFIPKPKTIFSEHPFKKEEIKTQLNYVRSKLNIRNITSSLSTAEKEYNLSRSKELLF